MQLNPSLVPFQNLHPKHVFIDVLKLHPRSSYEVIQDADGNSYLYRREVI
jgi:hypothetical protein